MPSTLCDKSSMSSQDSAACITHNVLRAANIRVSSYHPNPGQSSSMPDLMSNLDISQGRGLDFTPMAFMAIALPLSLLPQQRSLYCIDPAHAQVCVCQRNPSDAHRTHSTRNHKHLSLHHLRQFPELPVSNRLKHHNLLWHLKYPHVSHT